MKQQTIQVYWNGHDSAAAWHVALHDGVAIAQIYRQFRNPLDAIRFALDVVATKLNLPVIWPEWLKVVIA
jgi:hypothetical protein